MPPFNPSISKGGNGTQPPFNPPGGGDLTLRSSDGTDFQVHSTYLKLGSSVFADMMVTGTTKDIVELTENAIEVLYLLRFIYPNRLPVTLSLDELPSCLLVAQKYDVEEALDIIDEIIAMDGLPHKSLSSDPVRAYQLAVQFNLTKTKVASASLLTTSQVNFCDLSKLPELTQKYSSMKLIRMMNLQAMRSKALSDVLFDFRNESVLPGNSDFFYDLSCGNCRPSSGHTNVTQGVKNFPTTWSVAWARLVYDTLLVSPIDKSLFLFEGAVLKNFISDDHVCQGCLTRIEDSHRPHFESWIAKVMGSLEVQLERLEPLYAI